MVIRVSLKEALQARPGSPTLVKGYSKKNIEAAQSRAVAALNAYRPQLITCRPMWEEGDFRTFTHLLDMVLHPTDGVPSVMAESWLAGFKKKHGHEKCDMMLAELRRRDAQAWFAKKDRREG